MSDTDSNPDYPPLSQNLFNTHSVPVKYPEVYKPSTPPLGSLPPSPRPKSPMAPGDSSSSSGQNPMFSFSARVDKKTPADVTLDSIGKLTGHDNYQIWSASMTIVLKGIKAYEIVVDGVSPADDADQTEIDAFEHRKHTASTIFIQVVSCDILEKIVELEDPNLMWTWLRTEYYRYSAFALVSQIMNLVSLPTQYSGTDLPGFISKFESQWLHLTKLSKASSDSYRKTFATFLNEDKAKRDFLLGFLAKHHKNVINNLTTKDSLSYADGKQRLVDIDTTNIEDNSALFVSKPSGNKKKGKKPSKSGNSNSSSSSSSKTCTWCKKHNPGKSEGHTWNECFRLQKMNKEKKEKKEKDKAEEANITSEDLKVRNKSFYFDTACTSHMTPYAGLLLNYSVCGGFVKSSSQETMEIVGKGDVVMDCVLRDGSVSSFCVRGVLHVPDLAHPLISWRKLREKGYAEFGEGDYISINKGTKVVFEAVFDGNLFKIPEILHSAHIIYDFWHQALGHLAPSTMDKSLQLYSDADIPIRPTNCLSSPCVRRKMTRSPRTVSSKKDRKKLELVHSDLSRPYPVPSYGNSRYFIILIDDATRVAWVRFMRQKSETTKIVKDFVAEMELQNHKTPATFRTDNGGEYVTKDLKGSFASKGNIHEFSPPYSPESNGVAEPLSSTMGESLRAVLESASTYDKKLWAEAVLTSVYIQNQKPHSALKDLTPYEAFHGTKLSIQHLQRFGRECYIDVPDQKRPDGKKLSPRAQRAIFTGYTNVPHHYRVFLPDTKKNIVSAVTFFPPLKIEGATAMISCRVDQILTPLQSNTPSTSVEYTYNNKGKTSDDMWHQWMDENPQVANDFVDNGHEMIARLMRADYMQRKRDGYLGAPCWVYDANNMAYQEHLPQQPEQPNERVLIEELDRIEEFDESIRMVVPADHFLEHHQSNQQSQLPLGCPPPAAPRPMTPPPIPLGQVVTRAGRVVNPHERDGFKGYAPEASMCDAPPRPPTPEPQPLEGIEESQWANLSVLTVEEPKSY